MNNKITRRQLLHFFAFTAFGGAIFPACNQNQTEEGELMIMGNGEQTQRDKNAARKGRLLARPTQKVERGIKAGQHSLRIDGEREALLYVPGGYRAERAAPLALMLHGAGGNAHHGVALLQRFGDQSGIVLLAPKSLESTWDVIADEYGADVEFIDRALEQVFARCNIDSSRLAIGGFSDGASYALSLGVINGELFTHIIAFSPGFMAPTEQKGSPRVYISHGTEDNVLPIERCSRKIVPQLQRAKYDVTYHEFDGPHVIPPEIARNAVDWFLNKPA